MDQCPLGMDMLISAYHDGELTPEARHEVESHLATCAGCRRQLDEMQRLSGLFAREPSIDVAPRSVAPVTGRFHRAINNEADRPLLRLGGFVATAAASLLIVGLAWLAELPGGGGVSGSGGAGGQRRVIATKPLADWERLAMTLRVEPRLASGGGGAVDANRDGVAQARVADWMITGLGGGKANHEDR